MAITQKTTAINDFGLQERERTSSRGTSVRYSVRIDATRLVHNVDTHELGRRPAEAIAAHLRARIRTIQASASPSTQLQRKAAAAAVSRGEAWATARYSGGRMGTMSPNTQGGGRLFNDSGRLAAGLVARKGQRDEWIVNVPANRFDPSTLEGPVKGVAVLKQIYAQLVELIPEFGDPAALMRIGSIRQSIDESYASILKRNMDLRSRDAKAKRAALASLFTGWL